MCIQTAAPQQLRLRMKCVRPVARTGIRPAERTADSPDADLIIIEFLSEKA